MNSSGRKLTPSDQPRRISLNPVNLRLALWSCIQAEQFYHFGTGAVIGAVVDDQRLLSLLVGQHVHKSDSHRHQTLQKLPSVIPRIFQEFVGNILAECQIRVLNDTPRKIDPTKRQGENGGERRQRFCPRSLQVPLPFCRVPTLKSSRKKNPDPKSFCLLLLLAVLSMVHLSLFFLISLMIFVNPMYRKAKGFSR